MENYNFYLQEWMKQASGLTEAGRKVFDQYAPTIYYERKFTLKSEMAEFCGLCNLYAKFLTVKDCGNPEVWQTNKSIFEALNTLANTLGLCITREGSIKPDYNQRVKLNTLKPLLRDRIIFR